MHAHLLMMILSAFMQAVENYQYETPSEFEDEEIDEDMAFTEEDKHQFGDMGMEAPAEDEDLDGEDLTEMPESDDEELAASDEVRSRQIRPVVLCSS